MVKSVVLVLSCESNISLDGMFIIQMYCMFEGSIYQFGCNFGKKKGLVLFVHRLRT